MSWVITDCQSLKNHSTLFLFFGQTRICATGKAHNTQQRGDLTENRKTWKVQNLCHSTLAWRILWSCGWLNYACSESEKWMQGNYVQFQFLQYRRWIIVENCQSLKVRKLSRLLACFFLTLLFVLVSKILLAIRK